MKNLEGFGVLEMSTSESQEIDGGIVISSAVAYGIIFLVGVGVGYWASR
ncbi:bacteriocin [Tenacibaculum dicentrarchi]|nr:bacteriocin [Tenacibaculum dicentrarchi]